VEPLHLAHLILLSVWGGLVLAEGVVELRARRGPKLREAAELHYWMDVLIEAPLLAGIVGTGAVLAARAWPLTPLHWVKIVCALLAIGMNAYCIVQVLRRRRVEDIATLERLSARVRLSGLGIPPALVALYVGLIYFRR
jgi:hypothetical protein